VKKLKFVVSLTNRENDYQIEQALSAQEAAKRLDIDLELVYAENDAIVQSQQLLNAIQSRSGSRPDGIIFEPAGGTAFPQAAKAAAAAGIGWAILNREADYLAELRRNFKVPLFSLASDHEEIGRIQGKQIAALLPNGGSVLLVQGPAESLAAKQRAQGMYETKPAHVEVKTMKANWTENSAHKVVSSWLRLSTSQQTRIDVIAAQDDSMALGARKAFQEITANALRDQYLNKPFLGIDGMPKTGQEYVRRGLLAATVVVPTNTGQAIEMMKHALQMGNLPSENTLTHAKSYPSLEELAKKSGPKRQGAGV
jgi:ABC-type sugar transport system substrate-binding protein